jgi:hypothetical protein
VSPNGQRDEPVRHTTRERALTLDVTTFYFCEGFHKLLRSHVIRTGLIRVP